ncbi:hypothetical protein CFELI_09820 [Corynebacterium felinum]|uniref:Uncharacterized protein n=1 Tax=Corynebacterium felinum TaxID=131318 RepID=A0ABU2BE34_9CORY|nr:hypothetical protein [Corynebacterium felinum]WJY95566.1 hypothetical protein CFELI_09820 [Corynebacterium felinum]
MCGTLHLFMCRRFRSGEKPAIDHSCFDARRWLAVGNEIVVKTFEVSRIDGKYATGCADF